MPNERLTEAIIRDHFKKTLPRRGNVVVEEQATTSPTFSRLLKKASKSGGGGAGYPEFFIYEPGDQSFLVVVECKASQRDHVSPRLKSGEPSTPADIAKYAVDGLLHYMRFLASKVHVVGVAISGTASSHKVSTYRQLERESKPEELLDRSGNRITNLRSFHDYLLYFYHDPTVAARNLDQLLDFSRKLHNFMRDYAKLTEEEKPLIISAILLGLRNKQFEAAWDKNSNEDLPRELLHALESTVRKSIPDYDRQELMLSAYRFIGTHPELGRTVHLRIKGEPDQDSSPLRYMVERVRSDVMGFIDTYDGIDIVGQFYSEFLRYTGGDGKGLGIVLTPKHLTELFVELADIAASDTVLDPCAGTGGFLISAMVKLDHLVGDNPAAKRSIRSKQLIGIEQQGKMFALGASNMILRGDGRSNLYRGSCFDPDVAKLAGKKNRSHSQPSRGLINPPFAQKGEGQHELDFVCCMLDMLTKDGIGVAVVPMSSAISAHQAKHKILTRHTLLGAMSLPNELFYPVSTITCALVFKAHVPHDPASSPTWFGYWKDDGFVKTKNRGRRDIHGRWPAIMGEWVHMFKTGWEVPGYSIKHSVGPDDEWCAEAYLETDYSVLTDSDFSNAMREYAIFKLSNGMSYGES